MINAIIFDFDGTVADTAEGIITSAYFALGELSLPQPDREKMNLFIGPPLDYCLREVCNVPEDKLDKSIELYRSFYSEKGVYMLKMYDGMKELFTSLGEKGIKIAVASAKPEVFLKRAMARIGADKLVSTVCGTTLENTDPSKAGIIRRAMKALGVTENETVMVGDRCFDIEGAKVVGTKSIGVMYGYGTRDELEEYGADRIANTPDEIEKIITEWKEEASD